MSTIIATVFCVGYMRPASGTWGSLAGILLAYALHLYGGFPALLVATPIIFVLGWWATAHMTQRTKDHDPSEIVIDEVVGVWIAVFPVSYAAWQMGLPVLDLYPGWIAGFLFFRLFDIWKPSLVGWADRLDHALGVMLDDVIAGIYAALTICAFAWIYHQALEWGLEWGQQWF